jgi:hypothetical protein
MNHSQVCAKYDLNISLSILKSITDDRDVRPQTCTNGLVFRECKHIKNIFEDVYFTKNSFHITLTWESKFR